MKLVGYIRRNRIQGKGYRKAERDLRCPIDGVEISLRKVTALNRQHHLVEMATGLTGRVSHHAQPNQPGNDESD